MKIEIRKLEEKDYDAVKDIYQQGIETKNATFEKSVPDWKDWNKNHLDVCRFIAVMDGKVVGWIA
ncbi:MAG TPA: N-acetyltransferase, partial [Ignavibacteria bacterium]